MNLESNKIAHDIAITLLNNKIDRNTLSENAVDLYFDLLDSVENAMSKRSENQDFPDVEIRPRFY